MDVAAGVRRARDQLPLVTADAPPLDESASGHWSRGPMDPPDGVGLHSRDR